MRYAVRRILPPLICVFVGLAPTLRAQDSSFQCEDHSLFVDRLSRIPSQPPLPESRNTKILATQEFSGFAKYGFDSLTVIIRFDQGSSTATAPQPTGRIRVGAVIQA